MIKIRFLPSTKISITAVLLLFLLFGYRGNAGTLAVGKPQISGSQYTFPILLDSSTNDVAVMDFHFQYDPQVFHPLEAQPGSQADYSNKIVNANQASPGEYIVVLWGPNQDTLNSGEVARIVMEYTGSETPNTQLGIGELTMANADGVEVASQIRNLEVQFDTPIDETPETPPPSPTEKPEVPEDQSGTTPVPISVNSAGDPELLSELGKDAERRHNSKIDVKDNSIGNSQFAKSSKEITPGGRLGQLALEAQNLRESLPVPETPQVNSDSPSNAKLDVSKKNGIIPLSLEHDAKGELVGGSAPVGLLAKTDRIRPLEGAGGATDDVYGASYTSLRGVFYLIGGSVLIGLVLLLSLRKKFFA